jgi:hypothetical protein
VSRNSTVSGIGRRSERSATGASRAPPASPLDARTLDALFEIGRGNLRAADDLALKSLDYAGAGHASASGTLGPEQRQRT